jgi:hypothetical protein
VFSIENGQKEEILEFIEKLMTLDVEQKLAVFSQTCDEYDRNPVSLLDDILQLSRGEVQIPLTGLPHQIIVPIPSQDLDF